ncbi:MAG: hypothetical protein GAK34_02170 [Delftia tsuruhatensis]|nr:MAG: hypothetical protein GAK34_02170 [Delftia tsuruhatensis]
MHLTKLFIFLTPSIHDSQMINLSQQSLMTCHYGKMIALRPEFESLFLVCILRIRKDFNCVKRSYLRQSEAHSAEN